LLLVISNVTVAVTAPDSLVTARAKGPAAVLSARTVAGQDDRANAGRHPSVVERTVQLIHSVWTERVTHLRAVKRNTHNWQVHLGAIIVALNTTVIGNIRQVFKALNTAPLVGV